MARSYTKSEYAQPLVDPKQTLFDTNIESWRYSGAYPWAVLTALVAVEALGDVATSAASQEARDAGTGAVQN